MSEEKLELSHNGLCDVNHCSASAYGIFDGSDFCKEHLAYFTDLGLDLEPEVNSGHPLLNPDSPHYQMIDGVEAIERMEQMYSTADLMSWAKITSMKYRLRIGHKDSPEKEIIKIRGYEAYYAYLEAKSCQS